jgi:D-lactate dehydrogenase
MNYDEIQTAKTAGVPPGYIVDRPTQLSLFARIDDTGDVQLINHIGVRLGNDPEEILDRLDRDAFTEADVEYSPDRVAFRP